MAKGSLLGKMPGDLWQKFANLRLLYGYMYAQPAKKLLFMGGEFGQWAEWSHDESLDWHLLQCDSHRQLQRWVADLNQTYRAREGASSNSIAIRQDSSGSMAATPSRAC